MFGRIIVSQVMQAGPVLPRRRRHTHTLHLVILLHKTRRPGLGGGQVPVLSANTRLSPYPPDILGLSSTTRPLNAFGGRIIIIFS